MSGGGSFRSLIDFYSSKGQLKFGGITLTCCWVFRVYCLAPGILVGTLEAGIFGEFKVAQIPINTLN